MSDIHTSDPTGYKKIRKLKGSHFTSAPEQRNNDQGGEQIKLNRQAQRDTERLGSNTIDGKWSFSCSPTQPGD